MFGLSLAQSVTTVAHPGVSFASLTPGQRRGSRKDLDYYFTRRDDSADSLELAQGGRSGKRSRWPNVDQGRPQ
jgi:hypothetical protein